MKKPSGIQLKLTLPKDIADPVPVVIFCHGWLGDSFKSGRVNVTEKHFLQRGWAVLRMNFPGHGRSKGSKTKFTITRGREALQHVITWMSRDSKINSGCIAVVGASIGGSVVIATAARDKRINRIVLLSPRSDFSDTTDDTYTFERIGRTYTNRSIRRSGLRINFYEKAKGITVPILVIHGTADDSIPYQQSKKLHKVIKAKNKKLLLLDGAGHMYSDKDHFMVSIKSVVKWITKLK